jgi:hypothetical protein
MARKKGSYQKRSFLDTSLGRFIYLVEPTIFTLLCPRLEYGFAPDIDIVLRLCYASKNESFHSKRFQSYIKEYVELGLRVPRKKKITKKIIKYYEKIRDRRILKKMG